MRRSWDGSDRVGWKCSLGFEVIHVGLFDNEVRLSPPLFIQTAKQRAGAGECFACFLLPCLLILGGKSENFSVNTLLLYCISYYHL